MQMHAIDHTKGAEHEHSRNVREESARIARGNCKELGELNVSDFDALIFPGGFGAAKNLSNWAIEGESCTVDPQVESAIESFHSAGKPIGACCIAPVLLAKCIPGSTLTVGSSEPSPQWPYSGTAGQIQGLGCTHVDTAVDGVVVDKKNNLITSAAYMYEGAPHEIFDSVGNMVREVLAATAK